MYPVMNHVSLFLKMFILYSFENDLPFPMINRMMILKITRVICDKKNHYDSGAHAFNMKRPL